MKTSFKIIPRSYRVVLCPSSVVGIDDRNESLHFTGNENLPVYEVKNLRQSQNIPYRQKLINSHMEVWRF